MVVGASAHGRTTLAAIDGLTCAGKSTLVRQVAGALPDAEVVTLDDFYSPLSAEEQAPRSRGGLPALLRLGAAAAGGVDTARGRLRRALPALRLGLRRPCRVARRRAARGRLGGGRLLHAARAEALLCATVYVSTPRETRLARLAERGYPDLTWAEHWMAVEDWYLQREKPALHAQLVVRGW